jgi:REP element-mobilizing transposase RayT
MRKAIADTRREGFRIVQYSVQSDHVHLVIESESAAALTSGMRSFTVRVAMRVNWLLFGRRKGRVWGDRYHRRDLGSPKEVRYALVYVLSNHLKHGHATVGLVDPCSSGPWFNGWMHMRGPPPSDAPSGQPARTWLLDEGWWRRGGGFIHLGERPRAAWRASL